MTLARSATAGSVSGTALFARYAYPPNAHGYCGPGDAEAFFAFGHAAVQQGSEVPELRAMSRAFDGAWPFLELIAGRVGADPLDAEVVEAYWVGNGLLDDIADPALGEALAHVGGPGARPSSEACARGLPHHSFAVFCVYPWARLLGQPRASAQALHVLDRCRIRTGRVLAVDGDHVEVESSPLVLDGASLAYGPPVTESVRAAIDGVALAPRAQPGDLVSLHWDWLCDVLTDAQAADLERVSEHHRTLAG